MTINVLFTEEKEGFVNCTDLLVSIANSLAAHGFVQKFPANIITNVDEIVTLEAGPTVDVLSVTQPWRIRFELTTAKTLQVNVGTAIQLPDDGSVSHTTLNQGNDLSGILGSIPQSGGKRQFIMREDLTTQQLPSYPMSYRLTVTDHGVALFVWVPGDDNTGDGNNQSWFVIQRSVANTNGAVRVTGKSPVYCIFGIKHTNAPGYVGQTTVTVDDVWKIVVREADVERPAPSFQASADSVDNTRIVNVKDSVAITEDNNYVISFLSGLNTQRYAYPTDELDIMAYTSADVVSHNSDVRIRVYGEATDRIYKAMIANGVNNGGMRILVLASVAP